MSSDEPQYLSKTVKTLRGTEARSRAKWEKDGWEFVSQDVSTLHTALHFRRPKPQVPWRLVGAAAAAVGALVVAGVVVSAVQGDDEDTVASSRPSPAASAQATATPEPAEPAAPASVVATATSSPANDSVLTTASSPDLVALLGVPDGCDDAVAPLASKLAGRTVRFNGSIAALANHGSYTTRYDILVFPGDDGPNSTVGPNLQFQDVGIVDLALSGDVPDALGPGELLGVTAEVGEYNPTNCLLELEPVATAVR